MTNQENKYSLMVSNLKNKRDALDAHHLNFFNILTGVLLTVLSFNYDSETEINIYLKISIFLALVLLILSISYTREFIDNKAQGIEEKIKQLQNLKNTSEIYKKVDLQETILEIGINKINEEDNIQDYSGEILLFFFYSSMGFLILSKINIIPNTTCGIVILLLVTTHISFKKFARNILHKISRIINKIAKK